MPSLLLCLSILCLSLHACHGGRQLPQNSNKDVAKKVELDKGLAPKELSKQDGRELGSKHDQPVVGRGGIHDEKPKDVETKEVHETISGKMELVSSSHVSLPVQTKTLEGTGRKARSVLGTGNQVGQVAVATEENRESNETDAVGDILSMDYEPPHRKPPIHN